MPPKHPNQIKVKKPRTTVTIERDNRGGLVRVTTVQRRKARDRECFVSEYNPLATVGPVPSIWPAFQHLPA